MPYTTRAKPPTMAEAMTRYNNYLTKEFMTQLHTIRERWQQARKLEGNAHAVTLADGSTLSGYYYLTEAGAATPSHDALNGFAMSVGFPVDSNGNSVNDRDYQRDKDAQQVTRGIARNFDSRAIQTPVIVSPDGIVLSGNGRTMAGQLAAHDGTDGAYIDHLAKYGSAYGFTVEQVGGFAHPRLLFVINDALPYTAATFARFNAREMKSQSKTEQAVKFGKLVDDATFGRITATINAFDTLGVFYANTEAATRCLNELRGCGAIDAMSYAEMFDGDTISSTGKEALENVLIGKAFSADPDATRKITAYKSLRRSVVFALAEVANNLTMAEDYNLKKELAEAVNLAFIARSHGYKAGERVSGYARQLDAFTAETVCNISNTAIGAIADSLNHEQVTLFKRMMAVYNHRAADSAAGQTDMFAAGTGIKTKAEILDEVKTLFQKAAMKEQRQAEESAIQARKAANIFVSEEQATTIVKGGYVEYMTLSGDTIVCLVESVKGSLIHISAKGGVKMLASRYQVKPTADHKLQLPGWLVPGNVITDGKRVSQRIESVSDGMVSFEWINGGVFDVSVSTVLQSWKPSECGVCLLEAA